ncbi:MAG: helix-turn-helix domain-containing protein [Solidesulfovibrio sp.]
MARPKSIFSPELALRAQADLETLDQHGVIQKLRAIIAGSRLPTAAVAEVLGVATETIWRWAKAYEKDGLEGLYPKTRRAKPSKLDADQRKTVLAWVDECRMPDGMAVHWTLKRLRQVITDSFGITLGINTIWVWLRKENRKLKVPRPRHVKGDEQAQEAFKKTPGDTPDQT